MAKFLDKKEQVIDFQLTPLGRRKLSTGKLKPAYYTFYDDGVIYDSKYVGFDEQQNSIHPRIKNSTSYLQSLLSFEEIENSTPPGVYLEVAEDDTRILPLDIDISPDKNILQTNKFLFDSGIGDAMFEGINTQTAPAWKVVTCQGEILSASIKDTAKYDFTHVELDNEAREFNIPQLEVALYYTKLIDKPSNPMEFTNIPDTISETQPFADGFSIKLVRDDLVVYANEVNTELLTENFDIEVFRINEESGVRGLSTATIALSENVTPAQLVGKTITINDSVNTVIFEFVEDLTDPTTGNVGVVVPGTGAGPTYTYLGITDQATQIAGAMYNLIAAIDDAFPADIAGAYPTIWHQGSDAAGDPITTGAGRCTKSPSTQMKCVRNSGLNTLNVTVGSVPPPIIGESLEFTLTNLNVGKNGTIVGDYSDGITVTNFTGAEIYSVTELERKFFEREMPQIIDGLMVSRTPGENLNTKLTTDAVEYYFDVLTDSSVDAKIACECASTFNKDSYYIDIDFDEEACKEPENEIYFDIYGSVTVPEICEEEEESEPCEDDL